MEIRTIPIKLAKKAEYNPRKFLNPNDKKHQQLTNCISEFGYIDPIIWNERTGNVVGGHQRLGILLAQGVTEIQVSVVNLPLEKEKILNLSLNKISGEWDKDKLSVILDELNKIPDLDVALTGFDLPEIENILADFKDPDSEDNFDVDKELGSAEEAITKPGDLIELGMNAQHRLLCGDVTITKDVQKLMGALRAQLCFTDPPYSVDYDRNNRPTAKTAKKANTAEPRSMKLQNDNLTPVRYRQWFEKVADAINEVLVPGAPFYCWNGRANFGLMHDLFSERNFKISCIINWAKESFSPSFSDYNEQLEHCLYGWKGGAKHNWYGPKNESTLWQVHRDRTSSYCHPTQKSLELAERAIRNSSKYGDTVFDAFLGSGTTLIAAARLGRRCFGIEIEPKYCDCIIRRYIALAGKQAVSKEIYEKYSKRGE